MKRLFLFLITCLCLLNDFAQNSIVNVPVITKHGDIIESSHANMRNQPQSTEQNKVKIITVLVKNNDTLQRPQEHIDEEIHTSSNSYDSRDAVLYADVVRRYSWIEGRGNPISQAVANKLPYYYRLSMKNDAGHYQLIEAMHGSELTAEHPLNTYILEKKYDANEKNQEWCNRLKTIGKWLLYSDLSGENVVEERAFEAKKQNAKLVYSMLPVRNDSIHTTISYLDAWGYPADMNENNENTYGSIIQITYDQHGYDAIIDYLDGEGYRKANTDGVDQRRYQYDDKGRIVLAMSCNCLGDYVIDNWGNCGSTRVYDDKNNSYTITYMDNNLHPMRMPSLRADKEMTYIRCTYLKDKWGRNKEAIIKDEYNNPDTTQSGIHRIEYLYTKDGILSKKYYDINNQLMNF